MGRLQTERYVPCRKEKLRIAGRIGISIVRCKSIVEASKDLVIGVYGSLY